MNYYPEPGSRIRHKVKVVSDSNQTQKELDHATGVDTSDLTAKKKKYCIESWSWQTRH